MEASSHGIDQRRLDGVRLAAAASPISAATISTITRRSRPMRPPSCGCSTRCCRRRAGRDQRRWALCRTCSCEACAPSRPARADHGRTGETLLKLVEARATVSPALLVEPLARRIAARAAARRRLPGRERAARRRPGARHRRRGRRPRCSRVSRPQGACPAVSSGWARSTAPSASSTMPTSPTRSPMCSTPCGPSAGPARLRVRLRRRPRPGQAAAHGPHRVDKADVVDRHRRQPALRGPGGHPGRDPGGAPGPARSATAPRRSARPSRSFGRATFWWWPAKVMKPARSSATGPCRSRTTTRSGAPSRGEHG